MASISLASILSLLESAAVGDYNDRNDPTKWEGTIDEPGKPQRALTIKTVSVEPTGFTFDLNDGADITLAASPSLSSISKLVVEVNSKLDADASVVFRPVPSIGNPGRFHLDFKRISLTIAGSSETEDVRISLAFPKK